MDSAMTSGGGMALTVAITLLLLVWGCIGGDMGEARERWMLSVSRRLYRMRRP